MTARRPLAEDGTVDTAIPFDDDPDLDALMLLGKTHQADPSRFGHAEFLRPIQIGRASCRERV